MDKPLLRALHLASFSGNIGDVANHCGAYRLFSENLQLSFTITPLEIREFYWGYRSFDFTFVELANSFDLLIIGGGNYFELWPIDSATGTSIDIVPSVFKQLKVPTLFFALGVDTGQGYTDQNVARFSAFVSTILDRSNCFLCVRNDGSKRSMTEVLGNHIADQILTMPDCGFFAGKINRDRIAHSGSPRIAINIAGDMLERRFNRGLTSKGFLRELSDSCVRLIDACPATTFELVPHIWRDHCFISEFLYLLPDAYLRRNISIAPLCASVSGISSFLSSYSSYDLVLGMRFHANVCPIGMGTVTRGLFNYQQVQYLYDELKMQDRLIDVRDSGFGEVLVAAVLSDLSNLQNQRERCISTSSELLDIAHGTLAKIDSWLIQEVRTIC